MIRDYQASDWPEICRVFDLSKPYELASGGVADSFVPLAEDASRQADFAKSWIYVWEEDGAILGFVGHKGAYIGWMFVAPAAFRRGIGRALLRHALDRIDGDPFLWSMKGNHVAISLYESEGFAIIEERQTENNGSTCTAVKMARQS